MLRYNFCRPDSGLLKLLIFHVTKQVTPDFYLFRNFWKENGSQVSPTRTIKIFWFLVNIYYWIKTKSFSKEIKKEVRYIITNSEWRSIFLQVFHNLYTSYIASGLPHLTTHMIFFCSVRQWSKHCIPKLLRCTILFHSEEVWSNTIYSSSEASGVNHIIY